MPDTPSLTIIKQFTYRDQPEEWSNTYHFSGTTPVNEAAWETLARAVANLEKNVLTSNTKIVGAYGYIAGQEASVFQANWLGPPDTAIVGSLTWDVSVMCPGDAAATVRWYTGQKNSKGKKIYCRKYFHDVARKSTDPDEVNATWMTNYATLAAGLIAGTLPGGVKYCGPQGAVLQDPAASPYVTTRTLKRRGKRPLP